MQLMTKAKIELENSCVGHLWKSGWDHHHNNNDLRPSLTILTSNNHAQVFPDTISWFLWFSDILRTYLVAEQELFDGWIQWITLKRCSGVMQRENPVLTLIKAILATASNPESCLMNSSCKGRDNLQLAEDQLKCFEVRCNTLYRSKYLLEYWFWEILVFIDKHCGYNLYQECVIEVENFKSRIVRPTIWSAEEDIGALDRRTATQWQRFRPDLEE